MSDWYQRYLVETGRAASLWLLVGFVTTYAVTRWVTLRIRSRAAPEEPGSPVSRTSTSAASTSTTRSGASCSCS